RSQPDRAGDRSGQFASGVILRPSRMHAGPDTSYPPVRSFSQGLRVDIHGCLSDRSWCDVGYGPDRGWMPSHDLASDYRGRREAIDVIATALGVSVLTFNLGPYWDDHYRERPFYNDRYSWEQRYFDSYRPSWGPRPDRSYWGGRTATGYTLRRVWMRAGPDYDYPAIRRIGRGKRVHVYGCLMDWGWCDVAFRSDRGWVPAADLSADYRGRRRAFNSIAPYLGIAVLPFLFDNYWDDHYRGRPFYRERGRWQRHYHDSYKPSWGPRPGEPRYRDREGDRTREVEQNRQALEQKQREEERARQTELDRQRDERNRLLLEQKKREEERARKIELDRQRVEQNRQLLERRKLDTERARKIEAERRQLELKQREEERARQIQQARQKAEQNRQQLLQKQRAERAQQVENNRLERERRRHEATQPKEKAVTPDNGIVAPN
ncbi:MAG: SH3 domain-containing protein, partial [Sphingomonadales bacterium]